MKNIFFTAGCLLFYTVSFCQGFAGTADRCLQYFTSGQMEIFDGTYPHLYIGYLKENVSEYGDAVIATREGNPEEALRNIYELIDQDLFLDELEDDPNFIPLHGHPQWNELTGRIADIKAGYNNRVRLELKDIQDRDQSIRLLYLYTPDPDIKSSIHDQMHQVDKCSAARVSAILDEYGWLGPGEIGSEGNETLFLAIQHLDDASVQAKYLPMLRNAVSEGRAEGWHLAFLTDRIRMNNGLKQVYGTQKILTGDPQTSYIIPLEDPFVVDSLRYALDMPSLAEDLEEEGIMWDLQKYLDDLPRIEELYGERQRKAVPKND